MTLGASIRPSAIASASDSSPTRRGHQTHPGGEHHTHRDLTPIRAVRPARLSTKQGSEAVSAGIGLRISRSGVRIPPGAPYHIADLGLRYPKMLGRMCQKLATAPAPSQVLGAGFVLSVSSIPIIRRSFCVLFRGDLPSKDVGSVGFCLSTFLDHACRGILWGRCRHTFAGAALEATEPRDVRPGTLGAPPARGRSRRALSLVVTIGGLFARLPSVAEEATIGPPELLAPRSAGPIVILRGAPHRQEDAVGGLTPAVD